MDLTGVKVLDDIIYEYKKDLQYQDVLKELLGYNNNNFEEDEDGDNGDNIVKVIMRYNNKKYPHGYCYYIYKNKLIIEDFDENNCSIVMDKY
jgi:hypothetical protein